MKFFVVFLEVLLATSILSFHAIAALPQTVPSITALRAGSFGNSPTILLNGFYAGSPSGGGILVYNSADRTTADNGCTVYVDAAGHRFQRDLNGKPINLSMCGAKCGGVQVTDGHSTSGSAVITSTAAHWTSDMAGWRVVVNDAGVSQHQIDTTIVSVKPPGTLTLAANAGTTAANETVSVYPDDTTAIDNAIAAANKAKVALALPAKATCGYANPGSSVIKVISAPGLYLNSGALWLAQTGPTIDYGVGLQFTANGAVVVGPGTISGLYQTDQGAPQFNTSGVLFDGTSGNSISGHVVIENTKGRAFLAQNVRNFAVSDLLVRDCGDFTFQNSGTSGDMQGRSMCGQVTAPLGSLTVKNYTGNNASQAGLLIYGPTDASFHASISNCHFTGNGYYGLDLEEVSGSIDLSNCEQVGNGKAPSGVLIYGGYIIRDVAIMSATNVKSTLIDSNAFVAESVDSKADLINWSFDGLDVTGSARHAGAVYIAFSWVSGPQRVTLNNVKYDNITIYSNSPACSAKMPQQQLLKFNNLQASQLYAGSQTTFNPQGNASQMLYVLGTHSNLGTVSINSLAPNDKAIYFDLSQVQTKGTPTFTGATRRALYASQANPPSSFKCP